MEKNEFLDLVLGSKCSSVTLPLPILNTVHITVRKKGSLQTAIPQ